MAKWQKGQKVRIVNVEGSRLSGFPCEIYKPDEDKDVYMVVYRDPAVFGGTNTGVYFWIEGDKLEEENEDE